MLVPSCGATPGFSSRDTPALAGIDGGADLRGVGLVQQALDRVADEIGIAQVAVAIHVRVAHRFDLVMHGLGGAESPFPQRIAFEHAEDFADDHAAGARRRRRDDPVAAIVALYRRALLRPVSGEIGLGDDAAAARARRHDGVGDRALRRTRRCPCFAMRSSVRARSFWTRRCPAA